jgi:hypothetical protein
MMTTREAVQDLGVQVRAAQIVIANGPIAVATDAEAQQVVDYAKGFVEGVALLAALMCETIPSETKRRKFLEDCGFDGEQEV